MEIGEEHDKLVHDWRDKKILEHKNFKESIREQFLSPMEIPLVTEPALEPDDLSLLPNNDDISGLFDSLSLHRQNLSDTDNSEEDFTVVTDNLDLEMERRHYTKEKSNADVHLCHSIVVCNLACLILFTLFLNYCILAFNLLIFLISYLSPFFHFHYQILFLYI